jgi:hypothetical protein
MTFAFALSVAACQQTVVLDQGDGAAGGAPDSGLPFCPGPPLDFLVESPEVIVALDRSAAMGARFGDGTIMLTVVRDAIDTYATKYQEVVRFGYVDFPGSSVCSPSQQAGCCAGMISPPALNFPAFDLALHACEQSQASCTIAGYQRPTTSALTSCALVFSQPSDAFRRYVLLVTNGRPDCGANQGSGCMDAQYVTNQLAKSGVETVVVVPGPLDPEDADCLQGIAAYGGAPNPPFFRPAGNPNELANELGSAMRRMAMDACELNLQPSRIVDPDRVSFRWKDMTIPRDRDWGWELIRSGSEIILHGEWCDHLIDDGPGDFALFTDCEPQR